MNLQMLFSRAPATTLLIASFIILFIIQALTGVNLNNPTSDSLIIWGANILPLTFGEQPWRLLSSGFLHIGLMHLLFNCFAMFYFGQVIEIMFGSVKFVLIFILSVIGGNILNGYVTWWQLLHDKSAPGISAGASGGIMGLGMALLTFELLNQTVLKLPNKGSKTQLKNLAIVMGVNLLYGFAIPGIDNAGHIGGAITGTIITLSILFGYRMVAVKKSTTFKVLPWMGFIIIAVAFFWFWLDLHLQIKLYI